MATRNLAIEKNAIDKFIAQRKTAPKTPADWAAVHKMAYPTLDVLPEELKKNPGTLSFYQDTGSAKPTIPTAPTLPPPSTLSQTVKGSDLGSLRQAKEEAANRVGELSGGNEALRVLQEAVRAKTGVAQAPIGESKTFEQAGVKGFGALSQSLNARGNEIATNFANFQNAIGQMAGTYKDMADTALFKYKAAQDEYNTEVQRLQSILDKQETHKRELEILSQKDKLDREMEAIKHKYALDELAVKESSTSTPTSYKEWQLAGAPGTYASWLKKSIGGITGLTDAQIKMVESSPEAKKLTALADMKNKLEAYRTLASGASGFEIVGSKKAQLDALYADLKIAYKEAANLGALTGPDVAILQEAIKPISGYENLLGYGLAGGQKGVLAGLDTAMSTLKKSAEMNSKLLDSKYNEYSDDPYIKQLKEPFAEQENQGGQKDVRSIYESNDMDVPYDEAVKKYGEEGLRKILEANGITFNSDLGTSQNYQGIGSLSKKYESGGDPGAIGYDSTGGWSYGTYQLAHDNAKKFIQQSDYADEFKGLAFNSDAWKNKWKEIARKDPEGFDSAQHDYIASTHLEPQKEKLSLLGIDFDGLNPVLKDVIWSTAVQHGGDNDIVSNVLKNAKQDETEEEIIKKIYAARWNGGRNFATSTPAVRNSVKRRFFGSDGELNNALSKLDRETYA